MRQVEPWGDLKATYRWAFFIMKWCFKECKYVADGLDTILKLIEEKFLVIRQVTVSALKVKGNLQE